ncbi:endonuclease/exonuclease/phosphatase family protein [Streptomyces sp. NPDC127118]|uniref:endonuclease/exonuclease/phosphatase family protein n=1 Tax=Streptomyces sp. NPDC127118 TaxID=3345369 RepID=UPI003645B782
MVVLQEAFDNSASDALLRNASAQYPYQTPVVGRSKSGWDATSGAYSAVTPEDGGVTVLSKWPIVRKEQHIYKDACGSDSWSNKGFAYTELNVRGAKVHVVGTHTQSTDSGCKAGEAAAKRGLQFKQIDAFLDAKNIPASEQVIVAGDFNVDSHSSEYSSMLADADLTAAPVPGTRTPSTPGTTRSPPTATPTTPARTSTTCCTAPGTRSRPGGRTRWSRSRAPPGPCRAGAPVTRTRTSPTTTRWSLRSGSDPERAGSRPRVRRVRTRGGPAGASGTIRNSRHDPAP